jgi:hypothetical protein
LAAAVGSRHRRAEGRSNVEQGASLPPLDSLFAVVGGDQRRSNAEHGACCCCREVRRCASSKFQSQLAGLGSQRTLGSPPCSRPGSPGESCHRVVLRPKLVKAWRKGFDAFF